MQEEKEGTLTLPALEQPSVPLPLPVGLKFTLPLALSRENAAALSRVLDAGFLPAARLQVDWGVPLSFGDTLPRLSIAANKPVITLAGFPTGTGATFTVALTDPDAPDPTVPKFAEFCHWLEGDLSLNEAGELHRPDGGDPRAELVPYFGSAPDKAGKAAPHAYALVVYLQRATLKGNPAVERYRVAPKSGFPVSWDEGGCLQSSIMCTSHLLAGQTPCLSDTPPCDAPDRAAHVGALTNPSPPSPPLAAPSLLQLEAARGGFQTASRGGVLVPCCVGRRSASFSVCGAAAAPACARTIDGRGGA